MEGCLSQWGLLLPSSTSIALCPASHGQGLYASFHDAGVFQLQIFGGTQTPLEGQVLPALEIPLKPSSHSLIKKNTLKLIMVLQQKFTTRPDGQSNISTYGRTMTRDVFPDTSGAKS